MYSYGSPHMAEQMQDGHLEHTYCSYMRIRDVALKTCRRRWMIGRCGERGSGISVLEARHDDDDECEIEPNLEKDLARWIEKKRSKWILSQVFNDIFLPYHHHHHHVALSARISLTLSRHPSLSSIASSRSSGLHPVSTQRCFM